MFSALYLNNNLRLIISIIEHSIDHDPHEESAYIYEYKQHTKRKLIDWCLAMCTKVKTTLCWNISKIQYKKHKKRHI